MKNIIFTLLLSLVFSLGFMVSKTNAQTAYSYTDVFYTYDPNGYVDGFTLTALDYYAGLYYDPQVYGGLFRTDPPHDEIPFDYGWDRGYASIFDADVYLKTNNRVEGKTYCHDSTHFIINAFTGQRSVIARFSPCLTVQNPPPPTPTPTPSPTATPTPTPTPIGTPTPTPTPTPMLEINTVGFSGDFTIRKFTTQQEITDPTWTKGSVANPENVVAYTKGTEEAKMKLNASFIVSPPPTAGQNLNAKVRVKNGNSVIAESLTTTPVTSRNFDIQNLALNAGAKLETTPQVKKGNYSFNWEVSFDNGQTWIDSGASQHIIYWTYNDPIAPANCESDGIPRNCTFVNEWGEREYAGLFDLALEKATQGASSTIQSSDGIAKQLAYNIDDAVRYDPNNTAQDMVHPLKIYDSNILVAECSSNAYLLQGLLRSIGIQNEVILSWGGNPANGNAYVYNYQQTSTQGYRVTFQTERPRKNSGGEDVEKNPHFTFHAVVKLNGKYYDPSYGATSIFTSSEYPYTSIKFKEAIDLTNPSNPVIKTDSNANPFIVTSFNLQNWCTSNCTNPPPSNKFCNRPGHGWTPPITPNVFPLGFPNGGGYAVFRPSTGDWHIKNPSDQSTISFNFGLNGDKIVPADYDGDGINDFAVFRPSNGTWYITKSSDNTVLTIQFGISTDKPTFGDFDGDGKSDISVFRDGNWYRLNSSDNSFNAIQFGTTNDFPVSGDYDGDGKTDFTVYRPSTGIWYILRSSDYGYSSNAFGLNEDIPISVDFDTDGKTDIAVFRPSTQTWYLLRSTEGFYAVQFGESGDIPSVGNIDEDGKTDFMLWSPSNGKWKVLQSETGTITEDYWGTNGDIPVGSAFNR
jgi:hypothetical protein